MYFKDLVSSEQRRKGTDRQLERGLERYRRGQKTRKKEEITHIMLERTREQNDNWEEIWNDVKERTRK